MRGRPVAPSPNHQRLLLFQPFGQFGHGLQPGSRRAGEPRRSPRQKADKIGRRRAPICAAIMTQLQHGGKGIAQTRPRPCCPCPCGGDSTPARPVVPGARSRRVFRGQNQSEIGRYGSAQMGKGVQLIGLEIAGRMPGPVRPAARQCAGRDSRDRGQAPTGKDNRRVRTRLLAENSWPSGGLKR